MRAPRPRASACVILDQDSNFVVCGCPTEHGLEGVANLRVRILEIAHLGHSHTVNMQFPTLRRMGQPTPSMCDVLRHDNHPFGKHSSRLTFRSTSEISHPRWPIFSRRQPSYQRRGSINSRSVDSKAVSANAGVHEFHAATISESSAADVTPTTTCVAHGNPRT